MATSPGKRDNSRRSPALKTKEAAPANPQALVGTRLLVRLDFNVGANVQMPGNNGVRALMMGHTR